MMPDRYNKFEEKDEWRISKMRRWIPPPLTFVYFFLFCFGSLPFFFPNDLQGLLIFRLSPLIVFFQCDHE